MSKRIETKIKDCWLMWFTGCYDLREQTRHCLTPPLLSSLYLVDINHIFLPQCRQVWQDLLRRYKSAVALIISAYLSAIVNWQRLCYKTIFAQIILCHSIPTRLFRLLDCSLVNVWREIPRNHRNMSTAFTLFTLLRYFYY